jgi:hypothetical protein
MFLDSNKKIKVPPRINIKQTLHFPHMAYLCVPYDSHKKTDYFPIRN